MKVKNGEPVTLEIAGADVSLSAETITEMWLDKLQRGAAAASFHLVDDLPLIGEEWPEQGGIFIGIARGRNGARQYPLILGPEMEAARDFEEAMKWAKGLKVGKYSDFRLPFRPEQALCFANVPEHFKKEWHWSCEQHASNPDFAWLQNFGYGGQGYNRQSDGSRARAVRQVLVIQ